MAGPARHAAARWNSGSPSCPTSSAGSVSLLDSLLSERFSNAPSLRLMEHAATLDLEDFEDSRAAGPARARAAAGRGAHDADRPAVRPGAGRRDDRELRRGPLRLCAVADRAAAIALVPAFIGEAHFNAQSYSLNFARTPERRELDYVRQTGASVETAKEVKIFGLNAFLIERYRSSRRASSRPTARSRCAARAGAARWRRSARSPTTSPTRTSSGARCTASSRSAT